MSYLFVGNLSKNVTEKALHNLFSKCGLCAVELNNFNGIEMVQLNVKDFKKSEVIAFTPAEFLARQ